MGPDYESYRTALDQKISDKDLAALKISRDAFWKKYEGVCDMLYQRQAQEAHKL